MTYRSRHTMSTLLALGMGLLVHTASARADDEQVMKYAGSREGLMQGHKAVIVGLVNMSGQATQLAIPNDDANKFSPKPELLEKVKALSPGAIVRVGSEKKDNRMELRSIKAVEVKPGEDQPRGYIYAETYSDKDTKVPIVALSKYGQKIEAIIPTKKVAGGDLEPDADLQTAVAKLKEGQLVFADLTPGRKPMLQGIYPYKEAQTGKLTKVTEAEVSDKEKGTALEIDQNGKTITALVPGKVQNKKWVADAGIMRVVKSVHANNDVRFSTFEDGGKTWLSDIQRAPSTPKGAATRETARAMPNDSPEKAKSKK